MSFLLIPFFIKVIDAELEPTDEEKRKLSFVKVMKNDKLLAELEMVRKENEVLVKEKGMLNKKLEEKDKNMQEMAKTMKDMEKKLQQKDRKLHEGDQSIKFLDKAIEMLEKQIEENLERNNVQSAGEKEKKTTEGLSRNIIIDYEREIVSVYIEKDILEEKVQETEKECLNTILNYEKEIGGMVINQDIIIEELEKTKQENEVLIDGIDDFVAHVVSQEYKVKCYIIFQQIYYSVLIYISRDKHIYF